MNGIEFVERYVKLAPDINTMQEAGIVEKNIIRFTSNFDLRKKKNTSLQHYNSDLEYLLNTYDLSNIEIGMFSFNENIIVEGDYEVFGKFETERIAFDASKQIVMLDGIEDYVIVKCAKNEGSFFEALILCTEYQKKLIETNFNYDESPCERVKKIATNIGEDFKEFYSILLGCFE